MVIEATKCRVKAIEVDISTKGMRSAKRFVKVYLNRDSLCEFIICSATSIPLKTGSISKIASLAYSNIFQMMKWSWMKLHGA